MYIAKKTKKKSGKKPGRQPGHKAHKRKLMEVDEMVKCTIDLIYTCRGQVILEESIVLKKWS
ncbi:MAG: hypothetical protein PV345_02975 [Wolbachia sp.]|nr:hypothetical protein [Wolbachia sp.]